MIRTTVFGASGFIGRHLVTALQAKGMEVYTPTRDIDVSSCHLGTVFYCIGLTADFRRRPFDTVTAHVGLLQKVIQANRFDRLVYLSSTRVYDSEGSGSTDEHAPLQVAPADPGDLYNLSKLLGESLVLNACSSGLVARISNVVGPDFGSENFVPSLIRDAVGNNRIVLKSDLESSKDYITIADVVRILIDIGTSGRERIYNVASGQNVSHAKILDQLQQLTGCEVQVTGGSRVTFPLINTHRVRTEFNFEAEGVVSELDRLVPLFREWFACQT